MRADIVRFAKLVGWEYFPIAFFGRLPFAMMIVGILTVMATVRGSVAEAGVAAAAAGLGTAVLGPAIGWLADRVGEKPVLIVASAASILGTAGFLALIWTGAPFPVIAFVAAVAGGTTPQVAPFSRSRLAGFAARPRIAARRERATSLVMSYESAMDETSFVVGPVLVGVLTTFISPWAPLAIGAGLTAVVIVSFALHPSGRLARMGHADASHLAGPTSAFSGAIIALSVATFLVGAVFGLILTALTEFMTAAGSGGQTGIVYGAMSVGAIVIAIVVATLPARMRLVSRWTVFGAVGVAGAVALALATSVPGVLLALFLSGCGIGAVLVILFSLGTKAAPRGKSTTVLTTLQSALVVGQAVAAAAGGFVAQALGSAAAFWLTAAVTVAIIALSVLYRAVFEGVEAPDIMSL